MTVGAPNAAARSRVDPNSLYSQPGDRQVLEKQCSGISSSTTGSDPRDRRQPREVRASDEMRAFLATAEPEGRHCQAVLGPDLETMKKAVRANLVKETYDVKTFYHETGFWQKIAKHPVFENLTLGVIGVNALWISIDTDYNEAVSLLDAHPVFQAAEHIFCVYFSAEWLTRFMAFEKKRSGLKDAWFVFDSTLVFMMVMETWVMTAVILASGGGGGSSPMGNASILRLFRLLRLSRMARMLRTMPELLILIKGMVSAMRSVGFVMLLLLILMYIFAIAFTQLTAGTDSGEIYFGNIPNSIYTLVVVGTFLDNLTFVTSAMGRDNMVVAGLFFVFVGLAALTVMNMLIGVLCEVVAKVAECEKEGMLVADVNGRMKGVLESIDKDGDGQISKIEFAAMMGSVDAVEALVDVGVDPENLLDFTDQIFDPEDSDDEDDNADGRALNFEEFMDVVLQFRSDNVVTVKEMVDFRKWLEKQVETQIKRFSEGRTRGRNGTRQTTGSASMGISTWSSPGMMTAEPPTSPPASCRPSTSSGATPPARSSGSVPLPPQGQPTLLLPSPRVSSLREKTGHLDALLTSLVAQVQALVPSSSRPDNCRPNLRNLAAGGSGSSRRVARRAQDFMRLALCDIHHVRSHIATDAERASPTEPPHRQLRVLLNKVEGYLLFDGGATVQSILEASEGSDLCLGGCSPASGGSALKVAEAVQQMLTELQAIRGGTEDPNLVR